MFLSCVYPLYKFRILDFHFRFLCFILTFFLRVIVQVKVDDFLLSVAVHSSALKRNLEKTGYVKKKRKEKREKRKKKEKRNKEKQEKKPVFNKPDETQAPFQVFSRCHSFQFHPHYERAVSTRRTLQRLIK